MWTRKSILLTGLGITLAVLGVAARSAGALGAGAVLLGFVVVNRLLFRGSAELTAKREMDIQRLFESDSTTVKLEISNPGKRLLFLEVRDRLPRQIRLAGGQAYDFLALPSGSVDQINYEIQCPLLGVYEIGPTDLRLEDPFGLFYEERSVEGSNTLWVLPRKEMLPKAGLLSNLPMPLLGDHQVNRPGDGFDFFALREYAPGDTIRSVNWKASARSGKMMVNQMMRTTAAEVAIFVDARAITGVGPEGDSPRIMVARTVATLVDFTFAKKDNPRVVFYSDHVREVEPQPADRMIPLILETLAEMQPKGDFPLRLAVSQVLPSLRPHTPVVIVSPLLDDPTISEAASILLSNDMILSVITPRPSMLPGAEGDFARALLAERDAIMKELQAIGATVVDLEPNASLQATLEKGRMLLA